MKASIGAAALLLALTPGAHAADVVSPALPTFALNAPPADPSPWTGFYVGSEVFAIGGKGVRGGFGGGGYAGYARELPNNWVVGIQAETGYSPSVFSLSPYRGFNYADASVTVGYDMGRLMPFVTMGGGGLRPTGHGLGGYGGAAASMNDLFASTGDLRGYGTVGAGFAYKLTPNTTVELAVQAYRGNGF